ncbi:MAG: CHAT domain-containing protein [Cyanobacteria bacterium]|nr:CHAT domain-containing protein [Cyanobacteria bacterium CG_2015-16_32_12]NCO79070.1 CHAT domain-containing protein [Cyanobacteria bacterium CG_2015-22_32_23]NCQ05214.1 CHAT domain-containing protein [Cyanobacteria bacterium CG_2015-09_32_10]NCS86004.1 CHAT domain-containing protein [Cyanobacteria bacterium CG_2015-02_32_10]
MAKKLIIFKIGEGTFESGFPLSIRLSQDDTKELLVETEGRLPPAPNLYKSYTNWQCSYRNLSVSLRLGSTENQVTNVAVSQCQEYIDTLQININQWLEDSQVQCLLLDLFPHLHQQDLIRFVIQTADVRLWQLPWHLWSVWHRYPQTEIALSKPNCQKPNRKENLDSPPKVKILAILGDRRSIDVERDRRILNSLPNAEVVFLDQPNLTELTPLWEQSWQILFFAGHSSSKDNSKCGLLQINPYETIDIQRLKNTLAKAIHNGLELAIFNSCDGLGLGFTLADLQLPQTIIMREAVPDEVAQEFLKYFLQAYSEGETLYQAVKDAKAKIQDLYHLEEQAPGSSWLPVICQNLAVDPPLWSNLIKKKQISFNSSFSSSNKVLKSIINGKTLLIGITAIIILTALVTTGLILIKKPLLARPIRNPQKGICECPYDIDALGRECGNKSAYSRPGGTNPVCFFSDKIN